MVLQNPEDFDGQTFQYGFDTEPLELDNIKLVDFHGREAIRLNRIETAQYGLPDQLKTETLESAMFIDPTTYRFVGAHRVEDGAYTQADVVTDIYPIPDRANTGDSKLMSQGYYADFYANEQLDEDMATFTETWELTAVNDNQASLCIVARYKHIRPKGHSRMDECYLINQYGDILNHTDKIVSDLEIYHKPRVLMTPE